MGVASGAISGHHTTRGETHLINSWHRSQVPELSAKELIVNMVPCTNDALVDDNINERTNRIGEDFLQQVPVVLDAVDASLKDVFQPIDSRLEDVVNDPTETVTGLTQRVAEEVEVGHN